MVFLNTPGSNDLVTLNDDKEAAPQCGVNAGVSHFGFRLAEKSDLDRAIREVEADLDEEGFDAFELTDEYSREFSVEKTLAVCLKLNLSGIITALITKWNLLPDL